jgi:hypothetical protein
VEELSGVINDGDEACTVESWDIRTDRSDVRRFVVTQLIDWQDCAAQGCPPATP